MRTTYQVLELLYEWHLPNMDRVERRFIRLMWDAAQGIGSNPTDEMLSEHCGLSPKRMSWIRAIGKQFLIK